MLQLNQTVINKKGQKGTITRIITKSTGYVEVSYEDGSKKKEMAFNLTDENGKSLRKAPKKPEPKPISPFQKAVISVMSINGAVYGDRYGISYRVWRRGIDSIWLAAREQSNDFIMSVCDSCDNNMQVSEKQAYYLAKFALANNIEL